MDVEMPTIRIAPDSNTPGRYVLVLESPRTLGSGLFCMFFQEEPKIFSDRAPPPSHIREVKSFAWRAEAIHMPQAPGPYVGERFSDMN